MMTSFNFTNRHIILLIVIIINLGRFRHLQQEPFQEDSGPVTSRSDLQCTRTSRILQRLQHHQAHFRTQREGQGTHLQTQGHGFDGWNRMRCPRCNSIMVRHCPFSRSVPTCMRTTRQTVPGRQSFMGKHTGLRDTIQDFGLQGHHRRRPLRHPLPTKLRRRPTSKTRRRSFATGGYHHESRHVRQPAPTDSRKRSSFQEKSQEPLQQRTYYFQGARIHHPVDNQQRQALGRWHAETSDLHIRFQAPRHGHHSCHA